MTQAVAQIAGRMQHVGGDDRIKSAGRKTLLVRRPLDVEWSEAQRAAERRLGGVDKGGRDIGESECDPLGGHRGAQCGKHGAVPAPISTTRSGRPGGNASAAWRKAATIIAFSMRANGGSA